MLFFILKILCVTKYGQKYKKNQFLKLKKEIEKMIQITLVSITLYIKSNLN